MQPEWDLIIDPFGSFFSDAPVIHAPMNQGEWKPKCDITETTTALKVYLDLPGVSKQDVQIEIDAHGAHMTISGTSVLITAEEDEKYHHTERNLGNFSRTFRVPKRCDTQQITAAMENGVLMVTVPKCPHHAPASKRKLSIS